MNSSSSPEPSGDDAASAVSRIVLVDDHAVVRTGLVRFLDDLPAIAVVGEASTAAEALKTVAAVEPDLVVLDFSLPDMDAPALIDALRVIRPRLPTLVVSIHGNVHYALRAMRAGATGYILKSDAPDDFQRAIAAAAAGRTYVTPRLRDAVARGSHIRLHEREGLDRLSPREFQLLRYIVRGYTLQEVARDMDVSGSTVSTYRRRLMDKLGARNNVHLVRLALEYDVDDSAAS